MMKYASYAGLPEIHVSFLFLSVWNGRATPWESFARHTGCDSAARCATISSDLSQFNSKYFKMYLVMLRRQ